MKIVIDARFYGFENAGLGRYAVELIDNLQKIDKSNKYYLLLRKKYYKSLKLNGNFHKVLADYKHYSISEQINIPKLVRKINPDFTHYLHFNVPILAPRPFIVTVHDMIMHKSTGIKATTLPFYLYTLKRIGYKLIFRNSVKKSSHIITPSKTVKDEISKYFGVNKNRITYMHLGIDKGFFARNINNQDKNYFLYVGNAYPHKNLVQLIKAIALSNKKLKIVTARNIFYRRLSKKIKDLNASKNVDLYSFVEEKKLRELYKNATAFVYPSLVEGFGFQGLEAMASGVPVLCSDIKIFKETYKDNAIYFDPHNLEGIVASLERINNLSKNDRKKIIRKSQEYAKNFTWQNTVQKTLEIYSFVA